MRKILKVGKKNNISRIGCDINSCFNTGCDNVADVVVFQYVFTDWNILAYEFLFYCNDCYEKKFKTDGI